MAQADQIVQDATFPTVRSDINDNLAALFSQSSGNSEPAVKVANQNWVDTSSSPPVWKIRNASNTGWITVGILDPTGFRVGGITSIANGGTGAITAALALAALLPDQTGNAGKQLGTDGTTATWQYGSGIVSGTAVASTSGTTIDFTNIPAGVKRVTVMFDGVSLNGASEPLLQIGTSGGIQNTGYDGVCGFSGTSGGGSAFSTGFKLFVDLAANNTFSGIGTICLLSAASTGTWAYQGIAGISNNTGIFTTNSAGSKTLSGTLDRIRITTDNGTDTFDAGAINILYES